MLYYAVNKAIMNDRVLYRVFKRGMEIIYFPLTSLKALSVTTLKNKKEGEGDEELITQSVGFQLKTTANITNTYLIPQFMWNLSIAY